MDVDRQTASVQALLQKPVGRGRFLFPATSSLGFATFLVGVLWGFGNRGLNLLGRYSFTASTPAAGALRPLRDPDAPELDEDDDGGEPD